MFNGNQLTSAGNVVARKTYLARRKPFVVNGNVKGLMLTGKLLMSETYVLRSNNKVADINTNDAARISFDARRNTFDADRNALTVDVTTKPIDRKSLTLRIKS